MENVTDLRALFVIGGLVGGALLGWTMSFAQSPLRATAPDVAIASTSLVIALLSLFVARVRSTLERLSWRRQVPAGWGIWRRGSKWMVGWGIWLGSGLLTHASTSGVALLVIITMGTLDPLAVQVVGVVYGISRASTIALAPSVGWIPEGYLKSEFTVLPRIGRLAGKIRQHEQLVLPAGAVLITAFHVGATLTM